MRLISLLALVAIAACSPAKDERATPPPSQVEEWAAIANARKPGADNNVMVDLQLQVTVTGGWKVYSLTQGEGGPAAMTVSVDPPYEIAGEIKGPPPVKAKDPNFGIETETYSGEQVFTIPLKLTSSTLAPPPIEVKVRSQACSDRLCLPARTRRLTVTPEVGAT